MLIPRSYRCTERVSYWLRVTQLTQGQSSRVDGGPEPPRAAAPPASAHSAPQLLRPHSPTTRDRATSTNRVKSRASPGAHSPSLTPSKLP